MSVPDAAAPRRGRRQLLLIVALFLLPPVAAWVAWQHLDTHGVTATTNAGRLVMPPRPLEVAGLHTAGGAALAADHLRGRWTYVLLAGAECDARCTEQLYLTRQVRLAVNKDIGRVQRLLVLGALPTPAVAAWLREQHADLTWAVRADGAEHWLSAFRDQDFDAEGPHHFLVDPLGNLMMVYDSQVPAKGMLKDLRKLLKVSQIG